MIGDSADFNMFTDDMAGEHVLKIYFQGDDEDGYLIKSFFYFKVKIKRPSACPVYTS